MTYDTPLNDEAFATLIDERCSHGDTEAVHSDADSILVELALRLGYVKTVAAWERVDKWYA